MISANHNKESMKNILVITLTVLGLFCGMAQAQDNLERRKIEFLISSVENLNGAKFIRNGSEYTGKEAAEHLRMKLQKAGSKVQTADDFIRICASASSLSGRPYMIKSSDGKVQNAAEYFRKKLTEFHQP